MKGTKLPPALVITAAVLLATASAASAGPIAPNVRPVPIGGSSEPSLSSVLGCVFYGGPSCDPATTLLTYNAVANEMTNGLFAFGPASTVALNYEYTGGNNPLGLWSPNGPGISTLPLFSGTATGTTNGGMRVDFPITVSGSLSRRISTQLGSGGPKVRIVTTNGGVHIAER